jgi:hypothetical protein
MLLYRITPGQDLRTPRAVVLESFALGSLRVSWDRPFDQAVLLPYGGPARTLRDAANYIRKLPKSEHDGREWRLAIHMLIEAAEDCGTMLFARVGMLRAIEHDAERALNRN